MPDPFYHSQAEQVRSKYMGMARQQGAALAQPSKGTSLVPPTKRPHSLGMAAASSAVHHCSLPDVQPNLLQTKSKAFQTDTAAWMAREGRINESSQRSAIAERARSSPSLGAF